MIWVLSLWLDKSVGRNLKHEKQNLIKSLSKVEAAVAKKKHALKVFLQKFLSIKNLMKRNQTTDNVSHVKFPFLLVVPAAGNDTLVE